jgi:hypothetical protein
MIIIIFIGLAIVAGIFGLFLHLFIINYLTKDLNEKEKEEFFENVGRGEDPAIHQNYPWNNRFDPF